MPVTIKPSPDQVGRNKDHTASTVEGLLAAASVEWYPHQERRAGKLVENRRILQSSFQKEAICTIPYGNGFVHGAIRAFQQDLHLVLRPDDIWLSILTQFSMYVNRNAEMLRSKFVAHKGKKELQLDIRPNSVWDVDMGTLAETMTLLLQKNVVDAELRNWIIPDFTTTTKTDIGVASVVMMGTLQKYFDYVLRGGCGFPSVTLLGEPSDWEKILRRLDRLSLYGNGPSQWARLLVPILNRMIATFYMPNSPELKDFWMRICHKEGKDGSGTVETYSGWITAFSYWNEDGMRLGLSSSAGKRALKLDGIEYPIIRPSSISDGVIKVPVSVEDVATNRKHKCTLVAGSVGMTATNKANSTIVQPHSGWWMLEDSVEVLHD